MLDKQEDMPNNLCEITRLRLCTKISDEIRWQPERDLNLLDIYHQQYLNMKDVSLLLELTESTVS